MNEVFDKLLAVEFGNLPAPVQAAHLVKPLMSLPVHTAGAGFELLLTAELERPAPVTLMPKLAIKGWRDAGTLGLIYEGVTMLKVARLLLSRPTPPQRTVARAWLQTGNPLHLHLLPYVDFSEISEARYLVNSREVRLVSTCLRGRSASVLGQSIITMQRVAKDIGALLPRRSHVIDLACLGDGALRVVEINPALTPCDLAWLRATA